MKKYLPLVLLACAFVTAVVCLIGDNSYARLKSLRQSLVSQNEENQKLEKYVNDAKHEIDGLQNNPRVLEKAARNELGLARPNETIFVFDDDGKQKHSK